METSAVFGVKKLSGPNQIPIIRLINTQALIDGLKSGKVGAAGMDVYEEESDYFFEDFSSSMINDDVLALKLLQKINGYK